MLTPMTSFSPSRRFEEVAPYLDRVLRDRGLWLPPAGNVGWRSLLIGLGVSFGGAIFTLATTALTAGRAGGPGPILLLFIGINASIFAGIGIGVGHAVAAAIQAQRREAPARAAARHARGRLENIRRLGKLARGIHPSLLDVAEEAARGFLRISENHGEEDSPARERARTAARALLDEIVLEIAAVIPDPRASASFGETIGGLIQDLGFGRRALRGMTATEIEAAHALARHAQSLAELADEMEAASGPTPIVPDATSAMREALGALRHERQAREELEQELRS